MERPAKTDLHQRYDAASIWDLPRVTLVSEHSSVSNRTFCQGDLGAHQLKPTTLLAVRLPSLGECLLRRYVPRNIRVTLTGKNDDGSFRTNPAKEYPSLMCQGMADAVFDFATSRTSVPSVHAPEMAEDLVEAFSAYFVPV